MRKYLTSAAILICTCLSAQIVINEVDYDQVGTDNAEFLELMNIGDEAYPMSEVTVLMYNGSSGAGVVYRTITDPTWPMLDPGAYFVICGNQSLTLNCDHGATPTTNLIQNGPMDAIVVMSTMDGLLDVLSYGGTLPGYVEGTGTTAEDTNDQDGISLSRWPNGSDTNDNNADFVLGCPTPGGSNVLDPVNCSLSTGISAVQNGPEFSVTPSAGGDQLVVNYNGLDNTMLLAVYATDGSLIAEQRIPAGAQPWIIPMADRHGQLVLVRSTSVAGHMVRRVLMP